MAQLRADSLGRVIVRLPNALGDTVMATGAIRRLARAVGPERLTLLGSKTSLDVLSGLGNHQPMVLDRKRAHRGLGGAFRLASQLRERFDTAVILPNSIESALPFFIAHVPNRLGYFKEGRRVLLTQGRARLHDAAGRFLPTYTGSYFLRLLDEIHGLADEPETPRLALDEEGELEAERWWTSAGLDPGRVREKGCAYIILVPGAAFGPSKIWLPERYAAVMDSLSYRWGLPVAISAGPGEEGIADAVRAALRSKPLPDPRLSLKALKSVFARAAFVVTNDTGPRHLAVAFDVPNVTIMGPNDPRYTDLLGERGVVVRAGVACQPCQLKRCPLATQVCMTELSVERVVAACESVARRHGAV